MVWLVEAAEDVLDVLEEASETVLVDGGAELAGVVAVGACTASEGVSAGAGVLLGALEAEAVLLGAEPGVEAEEAEPEAGATTLGCWTVAAPGEFADWLTTVGSLLVACEGTATAAVWPAVLRAAMTAALAPCFIACAGTTLACLAAAPFAEAPGLIAEPRPDVACAFGEAAKLRGAAKSSLRPRTCRPICRLERRLAPSLYAMALKALPTLL